MFEHILILCVGNLCRSPMAAALLRAELERRGRRCRVGSAGIAAPAGIPVDEQVRRRMAARGLDLSQHRATALRPEMVQDADLILVMEQQQRRWLLDAAPAAAGKTLLLGHWIGSEIPDPYLQAPAVYDDAVRLIDAAVASWAERIGAWSGSTARAAAR